MTRSRMFGSDLPFCEWIRSQGKWLPASGLDCGISVTDTDLVIHRYLAPMTCGGCEVGSRSKQAMMVLEVKTRNADPPSAQIDTLYKLHLCSYNRKRGKKDVVVNGNEVWNFGVSLLKMSGESPADSESMEWGRFVDGGNGVIRWMPISVGQLIGVLRFDLHPNNLQDKPFRSHHTACDLPLFVED